MCHLLFSNHVLVLCCFCQHSLLQCLCMQLTSALLKYEYQISLCETNLLGLCKMGIPREGAVGEGDSSQMGLFLEDRVKGAGTFLLAPAWHYGTFACVRLTSWVWHERLCETHMSELSCLWRQTWQMASTCFSITGKKNQNGFFNRESYWDFKMGFILIALGSGLAKRKSRGFLVFYLALTQSLILEKKKTF